MRLDLEPVRSVAKPNHKRQSKLRAQRGKFPNAVRAEIKKHFQDTCQECGGKGIHIHHVQPKGSGVGRGVFTNGLLLCNKCHRWIHDEPSQKRLKYWQEVFRKKHGPNYYKDYEDLKREAWEKSNALGN
ncbi:HNH endonuclease [Alkalihalobacillus trypoxylicola]|uniref:HNH domain-containing protein n=1 Tax=Alkalihalobacillus trypoxylicola TaxID=519424 RepID=A0A161PHA1_9BACI|nr:HNH endonuclease [Alkalihalobacillus trypoxylicola]KYG28153.1 hypothetical protein AZF04_09625 [Alkalihalobacillus trypoxylicola]